MHVQCESVNSVISTQVIIMTSELYTLRIHVVHILIYIHVAAVTLYIHVTTIKLKYIYCIYMYYMYYVCTTTAKFERDQFADAVLCEPRAFLSW